MPTPVKQSRRDRQAAETRQEILDTAARLFAERGFAATSIKDIAAEAGVAVQTIYSSVGSKGDAAADGARTPWTRRRGCASSGSASAPPTTRA